MTKVVFSIKYPHTRHTVFGKVTTAVVVTVGNDRESETDCSKNEQQNGNPFSIRNLRVPTLGMTVTRLIGWPTARVYTLRTYGYLARLPVNRVLPLYSGTVNQVQCHWEPNARCARRKLERRRTAGPEGTAKLCGARSQHRRRTLIKRKRWQSKGNARAYAIKKKKKALWSFEKTKIHCLKNEKLVRETNYSLEQRF